jgi:hypothetical protein
MKLMHRIRDWWKTRLDPEATNVRVITPDYSTEGHDQMTADLERQIREARARLESLSAQSDVIRRQYQQQDDQS